MITRRGFIKGGLAALAARSLPSATIERALAVAGPTPDPLPMPTMTLDEVLSTVISHYRESIIENIFAESVLMKHLREMSST